MLRPFQPERLGPGAIYHRSLDSLFRSHPDLIKVAEIEPQTLWTKASREGSLPRGSAAELAQLATLPQRRLLHGVGYPIGGTISDQEQHVPMFRAWAEALESAWVSEHLSLLEVKGRSRTHACGFLMPPLQTDSAVRLAAENIRRRTDALGKPFAFETGVNFFAARPGEMTDGEFFAAVAETADCGILLDLTNLWVNDRNARANIADVLATLPLDRVWEVHLAGVEYAYSYWLDAHSGAIDRELLAITREIVGSLPNLGTIVFEIAPDRLSPFGITAFLREMELLHELWDRTTRVAVTASDPYTRPAKPAAEVTPEAWETVIASHLFPENERPPCPGYSYQMREEDDRSFELYRRLIALFREGTIAEMLENTMRLLLLALGEEQLRRLLQRYCATSLPPVYPTDEALGFRAFMNANPMPAKGLKEVLMFEAALVEAAANGTTLQITLPENIGAMLAEIAAGRLPHASRTSAMFEIGVAPGPFVRLLEAAVACH